MTTTEQKETTREVPLGDNAIKCLKVLRRVDGPTAQAVMVYMEEVGIGVNSMLSGLKSLGFAESREGEGGLKYSEEWFVTPEGIAELDKSFSSEPSTDS